MRIFCEDVGIFDDLTARRQLKRLFLRVAEGQHTLIIQDIDRFLASAFLAHEAEIDRREWEELVQRSSFASDLENRTEEPGSRPSVIHASVGKVRGTRTATCRFSLSISEIGEWAEQPLRLLLENDRDVTLLKAAARAYGFSEIEEACRRKWLVVDGRGGCGEVLNRLKRRHADERLFVFADRDPDPVTGKRSSTSVKIESQCVLDPRVPFHITMKHEIENYVPEAILALHVFKGMHHSKKRAKKPRPNTTHAHFNKWKVLSDDAKDKIDMKKLFGEAFMEKAVQDLRDEGKCNAEDFKDRARTGGVDELALALHELATHL
jgi:hypothetical protein